MPPPPAKATPPSRPPSSTPGQLHPPSSRITLIYVTALVAIACFSLISYFLSDSIIRRQNTTAVTVNISGRQRMLSQRIAGLAAEIASGDPKNAPALRAELQKSIALMRSSHAALSHGDAPYAKPSSAALQTIYFGAPYRLDEQVRTFLGDAEVVANSPPEPLRNSAPLLAMETAARQPILDALNAAVSQYQSESEHSIAELRRTMTALTALMMVVLVLEALCIYRPLFRKLLASSAALLEAARTDPLTGCLNRRFFTEESDRCFAETQRTGKPLSVMLLDIDHFKRINDTYGHAVGDYAIISLVFLALQSLRPGELLGRLGGEEFAIAMPGTEAEALDAAERLRVLIAQRPIRIEGEADEKTITMTVSVGVAEVRTGDASLGETMQRADKALYAAKHSGRNRVAISA